MADSMSPVTGSGSAHRMRVMVGTGGAALPSETSERSHARPKTNQFWSYSASCYSHSSLWISCSEPDNKLVKRKEKNTGGRWKSDHALVRPKLTSGRVSHIVVLTLKTSFTLKTYSILTEGKKKRQGESHTKHKTKGKLEIVATQWTDLFCDADWVKPLQVVVLQRLRSSCRTTYSTDHLASVFHNGWGNAHSLAGGNMFLNVFYLMAAQLSRRSRRPLSRTWQVFHCLLPRSNEQKVKQTGRASSGERSRCRRRETVIKCNTCVRRLWNCVQFTGLCWNRPINRFTSQTLFHFCIQKEPESPPPHPHPSILMSFTVSHCIHLVFSLIETFLPCCKVCKAHWPAALFTEDETEI